MNEIVSKSFHNYVDAEVVHIRPKHGGGGVITTTETKHIIIQERKLGYRFDPHAHSFVTDLVRRLIAKGIPGLQAADTDYQKAPNGSIIKLPDGSFKPVLYADYFSPTRYAPSALVQDPRPVKDLDFTSGGAYAVYNWEV